MSIVVRLPCFHYWALCFVVVRRSLGHALKCALPPSRLPRLA